MSKTWKYAMNTEQSSKPREQCISVVFKQRVTTYKNQNMNYIAFEYLSKVQIFMKTKSYSAFIQNSTDLSNVYNPIRNLIFHSDTKNCHLINCSFHISQIVT